MLPINCKIFLHKYCGSVYCHCDLLPPLWLYKRKVKFMMNHISYFHFYCTVEHHGTSWNTTELSHQTLSLFRTHPIQHACPPLHCDALEDSQHGKQDVVKRGDSIVGSLGSFSINIAGREESRVTLHFSRQMDSEELQRKAPAGAESCDSALQGTIVLRPSRTISSRGGFMVRRG